MQTNHIGFKAINMAVNTVYRAANGFTDNVCLCGQLPEVEKQIQEMEAAVAALRRVFNVATRAPK